MYYTAEEVKDDMVTVLVFHEEPNHDTYTAAMRTHAMKRTAAYEGCSIERALSCVPSALRYLSNELSRIQSLELKREIDKRVWHILNPPHELTACEREVLADLEQALIIAQNCDAHNVNTIAKVGELRRKIAELKGEYPY